MAQDESGLKSFFEGHKNEISRLIHEAGKIIVKEYLVKNNLNEGAVLFLPPTAKSGFGFVYDFSFFRSAYMETSSITKFTNPKSNSISDANNTLTSKSSS